MQTMFNISVSKDQEPGKLCSVLQKFLKNLKCLKICVEQNLTANQYEVTCFDEQGLNYVTTSSHIFLEALVRNIPNSYATVFHESIFKKLDSLCVQ